MWARYYITPGGGGGVVLLLVVHVAAKGGFYLAEFPQVFLCTYATARELPVNLSGRRVELVLWYLLSL